MSTVNPIQAAPLSDCASIRHAFFTREGGVSSGIYAGLNAGLGSDDSKVDVLENRSRMAQAMDVTADHLVSPYQVHSPDIAVVSEPWGDDRPKVDGVVTNRPGIALGIVTADCGPILFADKPAGVVGACHAGWKGALYGVLENTIDEMVKLGAKPENIIAVLGPMISKDIYEVGPEFPNPFLDHDAASKEYFSPSDKDRHHMFDLNGYIVDRLNRAGVRGTTVNICTYADEEKFYSYRRTTHRNEPDYGRQLSAIALEKG